MSENKQDNALKAYSNTKFKHMKQKPISGMSGAIHEKFNEILNIGEIISTNRGNFEEEGPLEINVEQTAKE